MGPALSTTAMRAVESHSNYEAPVAFAHTLYGLREGHEPFPAHSFVKNALSLAYFRLDDFQACTLLGVVRPTANILFYVVEVVYHLQQGHVSPIADTLYVHPEIMKDTFTAHPQATRTNWGDRRFMAALPIFPLSTAFANVLARYAPTKTPYATGYSTRRYDTQSW